MARLDAVRQLAAATPSFVAELHASEIAANAYDVRASYVRLHCHDPAALAMHPETRNTVMRSNALYQAGVTMPSDAARGFFTLMGMTIIVDPAIEPGMVYAVPESVLRGVQDGVITSLAALAERERQQHQALVEHGIVTRNEIRSMYGLPSHLCGCDEFATTTLSTTMTHKWQPHEGVELGGEPATSVDIIDEIDALVEQQLATDEYSSWKKRVADETKCLYCSEPWHGLAITKRMQEMRRMPHPAQDVALAEYRYADDTSDVVCPGNSPR